MLYLMATAIQRHSWQLYTGITNGEILFVEGIWSVCKKRKLGVSCLWISIPN